MDRTFSLLLTLTVIGCVAAAGGLGYVWYTDMAYQASITGSYRYTVAISTTGTLLNATFFLPVPADANGTSAVFETAGAGMIDGAPTGWSFSPYGTRNTAMLKLEARDIVPIREGSTVLPYVIRVNASGKKAIETGDPIGRGAALRPVTDARASSCTLTNTGNCTEYSGSIFADYDTAPDTRVTVEIAVDGLNSWTIFGPAQNEYHELLVVELIGPQHRWQQADGDIAAGIGSPLPA